MTPTVVKAADAAQFLSFIPRMLGYHPTQSLVVIPFDGARSLGAMRFDLPDGDDDAIDSVAATVTGMVCRLPDADAVAAIAYTDARFEDEGRMPHRGVLAAFERRAHACGLRVTDLLCVAGDAWASLLDPDCPGDGRALEDLTWSGPADVPEPDGDQSAGADLPHCTDEERDHVARAMDALQRAVDVLCGRDTADLAAPRSSDPARSAFGPAADATCRAGDPVRTTPRAATTTPSACADDLGPVPAPVSGEVEDAASMTASADRVDPRALATVCRFDDLPGFFEEALSRSPEDADAYDAAALVWCLARPSLRDVALVQWSGDLAQGDEAFDAQLRWESGEEYPAHLAMRMWGEGDAPDVSRLETALTLARHAAAVAPRNARPGPLAMCAWLSWALGRSTHAAAYAERACEIEPEHGLSQIVLSFVAAGHLPDWAFRRAGGR
ncbi:DUF4192 family protein [Microbacterium hibisci]|uniref:DUF4192 family protein n=1 Tax=Microbacterium hibisci TaxID=2036000 RepID=UPI001944F55D|nr:DUF4192 family protein [Microbacterium hibisci]